MALPNLKPVVCCILLGFLISIINCGGKAYYNEKLDGVETVYYNDKDGQKKIVYQVNKDGSLTVYDENDPMYKNYAAGQKWSKAANQYIVELARKKEERAKKAEQARIERIQRIRDAKKRRPWDPIYVAVHTPQIEADDQKVGQKTCSLVHKFVSEQISSDKILRIASENSDVDVFSKLYIKQGLGFDKKTRKPVPVPVFYFEYNVRSNYLPEDTFTYEEHGHWMENQQIVQRATEHINKIIKNRIGPNIPAERHKFF